MTVNINDLSDAELAACVDLYCARALQKAGNSANFHHIFISAYKKSSTEVEVEHQLDLGGNNKWKGNNLFTGVELLLARMREDATVAPNVISLALPAPTAPVYAEFTPVRDLDDDVPF